MAFLVVLAVAVVVIVLVMRSAAAGGSAQGRPGRTRAPRPGGARPHPVAPDDDPEFLREISRRTRRDDGSPS